MLQTLYLRRSDFCWLRMACFGRFLPFVMQPQRDVRFSINGAFMFVQVIQSMSNNAVINPVMFLSLLQLFPQQNHWIFNAGAENYPI